MNTLTHLEKHQIRTWLSEHRIEDYIIHDDLSVSVKGSANFYGKKISSFPFQFKEVHGTFSIECCDFSTLENVGLPDKCGTFFCNNNRLTSLRGCPHSQTVICSNNHISSFEGLPADCQKLEVDHNLLTGFHGICKDSQLNDLSILHNPFVSFDGMPHSVTFVRADHCHLSTTKGISPNVDMLHCAYNQLDRLEDLPKSMVYLDVSHNQLQDFKHASRNIEQFFCGNNPVCTFENFPLVLMTLDVSGCGLRDEDLIHVNISEIDYLTIRYNPITTLRLKEKMHELYLSETNIQMIHGLKEVKKLWLSFNRPEDFLVLKNVFFQECECICASGSLSDEHLPLFKSYTYAQVQEIIRIVELKQHIEAHTPCQKNVKRKNKI